MKGTDGRIFQGRFCPEASAIHQQRQDPARVGNSYRHRPDTGPRITLSDEVSVLA